MPRYYTLLPARYPVPHPMIRAGEFLRCLSVLKDQQSIDDTTRGFERLYRYLLPLASEYVRKQVDYKDFVFDDIDASQLPGRWNDAYLALAKYEVKAIDQLVSPWRSGTATLVKLRRTASQLFADVAKLVRSAVFTFDDSALVKPSPVCFSNLNLHGQVAVLEKIVDLSRRAPRSDNLGFAWSLANLRAYVGLSDPLVAPTFSSYPMKADRF